MVYPQSIENLIRGLSKLPGIGEKSATRLAFYVLNAPSEYANALAKCLVDVKEKVRYCTECFNLSDLAPCRICADGSRDGAVICVVEGVKDLAAIEDMGGYRGRYHVLHGSLSPLKGVGPADIRIGELESRVKGGGVKEIILATSPDMEGEATALYITRLLKPEGVKMTRIATGIPVGAELEYMDGMTIGRAFEGRREV